MPLFDHSQRRPASPLALARAIALAGGVSAAGTQVAAQGPLGAAPVPRDTAAVVEVFAPPTRPPAGPVVAVPAGAAFAADTGRPHAVTYSDAYGTRLTVHRYASYATLPVFAAEYVLGNRLIQARDRGEPSPQGTKDAHTAVALGLGALFTVNTVTGAWNWWDARHDPNGRARRTVHSALMLAADAGFAAAGALAGNAGSSRSGAHTHRTVALTSMGVTTAAGLMMYLWKN